jgi:hypothetical protein
MSEVTRSDVCMAIRLRYEIFEKESATKLISRAVINLALQGTNCLSRGKVRANLKSGLDLRHVALKFQTGTMRRLG